jgi:hypothetical protein
VELTRERVSNCMAEAYELLRAACGSMVEGWAPLPFSVVPWERGTGRTELN